MKTRIEKAEIIRDELKKTGKFPEAKVWESKDGEKVRVYTGHRGEYLEVAEDGIEKSRLNMTWGHIIDINELEAACEEVDEAEEGKTLEDLITLVTEKEAEFAEGSETIILGEFVAEFDTLGALEELDEEELSRDKTSAFYYYSEKYAELEA